MTCPETLREEIGTYEIMEKEKEQTKTRLNLIISKSTLLL